MPPSSTCWHFVLGTRWALGRQGPCEQGAPATSVPPTVKGIMGTQILGGAGGIQ